DLTQRPRRLRRTAALRALVEETVLRPADFIAPLFVVEGKAAPEEIKSMPGVFRLSIADLVKECRALHKLGIRGVALFPKLDAKLKDDEGTRALDEDALVLHAARDDVENDRTVGILAKMAVLQARAGVDLVAPSDMMDGRVGAIRKALDAAGHTGTGILAYAVKYNSAYYGPFRDAVGSAQAAGTRLLSKATYQMNPANRREARLEATLDALEGADILMVKPA